MRLCAVVLAVMPGTALAVPVTLDFQGGVNVDTDPEPFAGDEYYLEEGFEIRAAGYYASGEEEAEALSLDSSATLEAALPIFLTTSVFPEPEVYDYRITRADGGTFSLDGFVANVSNYDSIEYIYTFEDGTSRSEYVSGDDGFIEFVGTRADGSTVSTVADGEFANNLGLTDIVRLEIDWTDAPEGFLRECDPRALAERDPELAALGVPDDCGSDVPKAQGVASISGFDLNEDFVFFTNYDLVADVSAIELSVDDPVGPAPIPLPASLPLLAGGLGIAAWVGRRRRG